MKRKWSLRLGAAVLCAVLLGSCGGTAAAPAESTCLLYTSDAADD